MSQVTFTVERSVSVETVVLRSEARKSGIKRVYKNQRSWGGGAVLLAEKFSTNGAASPLIYSHDV